MTVVVNHRHTTGPVLANAGRGRVDPTLTTTLRARFVMQMRRRWRELQADIVTSIVDNDCFGIQPEVLGLLGSSFAANAPIARKAFGFQSDASKAQAFMQWLEEQEDAGILKTIYRPGGRAAVGAAWTDAYVDSAYQQGIRRARQEMRRKGVPVPAFTEMPGGLGAVMNQPIHANTLMILYTRTFEDLKTVAAVTNSRIRRQLIEGLQSGLARGLAEGKNPITVARDLTRSLNNEINVIGKVRAEMIARTEIIRAHHLATINEYEQAAGEMEVEVEAEVSTAGDDKVCDICAELAKGGPYSLEQARSLIPAHPQCRCCAIPFVPSVMQVRNVRNRAARELVPQLEWLPRYLEAA